MANRIVPNSMVKVLADFRDDNPECVIRDLLPGKVPGVWPLLQSLMPYTTSAGSGISVECQFNIIPGDANITGRAEIQVKSISNLDHMIAVLGRLTNKWKKEASSQVTPDIPDWIGLQCDLTTRTGVIIVYRSTWEAVWSKHEKR